VCVGSVCVTVCAVCRSV
uniref:Uncharacterized protein n=1 Tax=Amphimedon queenslandica TaxID=400682 RepID=A0A1X7SG57_AMPQE